MEFVETPTFWCPHVDRAACTNFSPRTVELQPSESRKIFPFPFILSHFPFLFSLRIAFPFLFISSFLFFPLLFYSFSLFSSHFPFIFSSFYPFSLHFLLLFGAHHISGQRRKFPPLFLKTKCVTIKFPSLFLISLFPFYDIITYMAQCEPWDSFPTHG